MSQANTPILLYVRSGKGTVSDALLSPFTDVVEEVQRTPRQHRGWMSVEYKKRRFQVFGGIRTPYFIDLSNPVRGRRR